MSHSGASVAEHFVDSEQQHDASALGMWVFLVTEVMFFGALFLAYMIGRVFHPAAFAAASRRLEVSLGGTNTAVLILSSLTMALAVRAAQTARRKELIVCLIATLLLGCVFLSIKGYEYYDKFHNHLVPGPGFSFPGPDAPAAQYFFSLYFAMTGLHALHMIVGAGILIVLIIEAKRGRFYLEYYNPVEMAGLYWHFVDIIWIFLFPLLYLIDIHR